MKVNELIELYKENEEGALQQFEISTYLPIEQKRRYIDEALVPGLITYQNGIAAFDSIEKKVAFLMAVIQCYTDLEIEDIYKDYDALLSSGIMFRILETMKDDYSEFYDLFEARFNDALRDYNSLEAVVNRNMLQISNPILETIMQVREMFSSIKTEDIENFIKLLDVNPGK